VSILKVIKWWWPFIGWCEWLYQIWGVTMMWLDKCVMLVIFSSCSEAHFWNLYVSHLYNCQCARLRYVCIVLFKPWFVICKKCLVCWPLSVLWRFLNVDSHAKNINCSFVGFPAGLNDSLRHSPSSCLWTGDGHQRLIACSPERV